VSNLDAKYWEVLHLTASREVIEIISSLIQDESLGMIDLDGSVNIYFNPENKKQIDEMLVDFESLHKFSFTWEMQEMEPWHLKWKDNFNPIYVQNQIAVIPDWQEKDSRYPINIKIKPGMAFGTGHHETTYLMIEALVRHPLEGKSVLDLGTGSGILAITSEKLGASTIVGVEYDDVCEENFHENIILNDCGEIPFHCIDATQWNDFNFDYILANINRNILLKLIPNFRGVRSKIFLSGILDSDEKIIHNECIKNGLKVEHVFQQGEWLMMEICNDA
jgi:ribosomal protein L11 methyltransferase